MTNRLVYHAHSRVFMHGNQFGFTPGKETEHALHELRKTIEGCHGRGNDSCLIMLDVKAAFKNSWWPLIYSQLGNMGCPRNMYRLVRSFLSERSVLYRTAFSPLERQYDKGWLQGYNSGPFFWNMVANSLLELDLGECVRIIAYADDLAITVEAPNAFICGRMANVTLEKIERWAELQKLTFSAEKSVSVYFRKMRRMGRKRNPMSDPLMIFLGK